MERNKTTRTFSCLKDDSYECENTRRVSIKEKNGENLRERIAMSREKLRPSAGVRTRMRPVTRTRKMTVIQVNIEVP